MSTVVPITVIIPTYNRTKVLFDTIESILSGIAVPDEVIVVDQTIPETIYPEILFSRYGSKLKIVREKIPSLTRSRNIGLDMAKNDIVLFCDDDVLLDRHSIEKLYCDMQNSKVALVAGINKKDNALYGGKNKDNQLKAFVSTLFGLKKFWRNDGYVIRGSMRGRYAVGITNKVPTEWAMGYFFSVKKSLCDKCTIQFDENLKRYAYAEDLDFSIRYCEKAKIGGRACILNPEIYVDHLASKEWRTPSKEATLYTIANRRYLSYKIYPKKFWNRWLLLWNDWCCEKFVCKNVDERRNWHEARMLCKGMKIDELKELILNASKR